MGPVGATGPDGVDIAAFTNANAGNIVICEPVYELDNGQVDLGDASAASTSKIIGLVYDTVIANGASGNIIVDGFLTASTGQWDDVTGQIGGLTSGDTYYLSETTGLLTVTAPTTLGHYVVRVGRAVSSTRMEVIITARIKL
jgi:hypothetical protein